MKLAIALVLVSSVAYADGAADAIYKHGEDLFAKKQYLDAAHEFEASYALDPDPAVLFNIAQAYRLGRACAQAARYYHQFVDKVPNPPERDKLDRNIAEMDACAKTEADATAPKIIHDTKVVHDTRVVQVHDPQRPVPIASVAIASAGVVALGLGAYFTHDVHEAQSARETACLPGCNWAQAQPRITQLDSRGSRAEVAEAVSYGLGGVALVASIVVYLLRGDEHADPIVTPSGVAFRF